MLGWNVLFLGYRECGGDSHYLPVRLTLQSKWFHIWVKSNYIQKYVDIEADIASTESRRQTNSISDTYSVIDCEQNLDFCLYVVKLMTGPNEQKN